MKFFLPAANDAAQAEQAYREMCQIYRGGARLLRVRDLEGRVRDLEGAIRAGETPNSRRIHGCDGSNGRR